MKLTKSNIVNRINRLQMSFKVKWEDIVDDLDMGIDKINSWLGTKYPPVSEVLNDYVEEEKTYSYRAGGNDVEFFPNKYFMNIVIPFVITQILAKDEEFTSIYAKYQSDIDENLLLMTAQEINNVPYHLIDAPKGVYFQNPDPAFGRNPEAYFNRKIKMDLPRIQIRYDWNIDSNYVKGFVDKPLPMDNNTYEKGTQYMPSILGTNDYTPMLVDDKATVLAVFLGWSLRPDGEVIPTGYITLEEDITFYAQWDYDIIRFRYEGNGGTLSNWKPMYVNKNNIPPNGITPSAGIATRRGYTFIGFDPVKLSPDFVNSEPPIVNDGLFDDWELDQINETDKEPDITFTAQWERVDYKVTFKSLKDGWTTNQQNMTYRFGQEIILEPPIAPTAAADEFIGWWDNPEFLGDPVLKIEESDFGDKTFYANLHSVSYIITFLDLDGTEISRELMYKGSKIISPNTPSDIEYTITDDTEERGEYTRKFNGFRDKQDNSLFEEGMMVTKNQTFVATFGLPTRKEVTINLHIKANVNGAIEDITIIQNVFKLKRYSYNEIYDFIPSDQREYIDGPDTFKLYNFSNTEGGAANNWPIEFNQEQEPTDLYGLYTNQEIEIKYKKVIWDENINDFIVDPGYEETKYVANGTPDATDIVYGIQPDGIPKEILTDANADAFHLTKFMVNDTPNIDIADVYANDIFDYDTRTSIEVIPIYSNEINEQIEKRLTIKGLPSSDFDETIGDVIIKYPINTNVDLSVIKNSYSNFKYRNIESDSGGETRGFYKQANLAPASMVEEIKMNTHKTLYVKTFSELRIIFYLWSNPYSGLERFERKRFYRQDLSDILFGQTLKINPNDYLTAELVPSTSDPIRFFAGWNKLPNEEFVQTTYDKPLNSSLLEPDYTSSVLEFEMYPVFAKKKGFQINWQLIYTKNNITKPTEAVFFNGPDPYPVEDQFTTKNFTKQLIDNILNADNPNARDKHLISGYKIEGYKIDSQPWRDGESEFPIAIYLGAAQNHVTKEIDLDISLIRDNDFILIQVFGNSSFIKSDHLKYRKVFVPKNKTWNEILAGGYLPETTNTRFEFRVITPWDYDNHPDQPIAVDLQVEVYDAAPPIDNAPIVGTIYCSDMSGQKNIVASVKNNNNYTVQLFVNNAPRGDLLANEEKVMTLTSNINIDTPYTYNYNISFKATGRSESNTIQRTDTIHMCISE